MKAAVISLGSVSSKWIVDGLKNYFKSVDDMDIRAVEVTLGAENIEVTHLGKVISDYDCIYVRGSYKYAQIQSTVTATLRRDAYMPIKANAFIVGHNKFLTQLLFQQKKVPMPKSYLAVTAEGARKILEKVNYPIILKFPEGTQGKGVLFSESYASASSMLDALLALGQPFIIQEYVETGGVDVRAIVAGGKVVASMKRKAERAEKRANIHVGATGEGCVLNTKASKIALKAAEAIGADICAVDILETPKGPVVLEVNLSPGLQGITKATDVNVGDEIAKALHKKTEEWLNLKGKEKEEEVMHKIEMRKKEKVAKEIVSPLTFRGDRILLPEIATKMAGFSEDEEYSIRVEDGKLIIERT
ncbi:RimK family alpha-L-glutamate ligase [Candidatus Woesearchaeota archaeon]|nr:RimK family alpha-L-glutamate ligase [Candidatus Woesearchaeota archaeon]